MISCELIRLTRRRQAAAGGRSRRTQKRSSHLKRESQGSSPLACSITYRIQKPAFSTKPLPLPQELAEETMGRGVNPRLLQLGAAGARLRRETFRQAGGEVDPPY